MVIFYLAIGKKSETIFKHGMSMPIFFVDLSFLFDSVPWWFSQRKKENQVKFFLTIADQHFLGSKTTSTIYQCIMELITEKFQPWILLVTLISKISKHKQGPISKGFVKNVDVLYWS